MLARAEGECPCRGVRLDRRALDVPRLIRARVSARRSTPRSSRAIVERRMRMRLDTRLVLALASRWRAATQRASPDRIARVAAAIGAAVAHRAAPRARQRGSTNLEAHAAVNGPAPAAMTCARSVGIDLRGGEVHVDRDTDLVSPWRREIEVRAEPDGLRHAAACAQGLPARTAQHAECDERVERSRHPRAAVARADEPGVPLNLGFALGRWRAWARGGI